METDGDDKERKTKNRKGGKLEVQFTYCSPVVGDVCVEVKTTNIVECVPFARGYTLFLI